MEQELGRNGGVIGGVSDISREELTQKLYGLGVSILCAARDELYVHMHFLDVALSSFVYEMTTDIYTAGTDGARMYFDTGRLGNLFKENRILVNRAYLHMVFHCIFRHMFVRPPDGRLWDISCDIAVEYLIDKGHYRSTRWSRSLFRREIYGMLEAKKKTLHAQRIYRYLQEIDPDEAMTARMESEFCVCDHRYWDCHQPERPQDPQLENHWRDVDEKIETQMTTFGSQAAQGAGDWLGSLQLMNRRRTDYSDFLRKFTIFREEAQLDPDTFDMHFYSYGLSVYKNMPLIEPQETREVQKIRDFVIVIDTSMSTVRDQVVRFFEKTYEILACQRYFFSRCHVHIIQCDEQVQHDTIIRSGQELEAYMRDFTLYGGGGTDFRPAFTYVMEKLHTGEMSRLKGMLYFTDGCGIYPKERPPYDVAFIFLPEQAQEAQVPPWAMKIVLEEEELQWT